MIKITLAMHDHDFKILSKNTLRLILKKNPQRPTAYRTTIMIF